MLWKLTPPWGTVSTNIAVGSFTAGGTTAEDTYINGNVGVGMNSMAAIGTTDKTWLAGQINSVTNGTGLTENGVDSALGIYSAQVLGNGKGIVVDGTKTSGGFTYNSNRLEFSGKSLLVINAAAALTTAGALSSATLGGGAIVSAGAKLRIAGAQAGKTYQVLGTNITPNYSGDGWNGANLSTDSTLITLERLAGAQKGSFKGKGLFAHNIYTALDSSLQNALDGMYGESLNGVDSLSGGAKFLSRATGTDYTGTNYREGARDIESLARIGVTGAVPQLALAASNAANTAIQQRTSFGSVDGGSLTILNDNQTGQGTALWLLPLYQKIKSSGFEAGSFDYGIDGHMTGAALGADYTFDDQTRAGITFTFGSGSSASCGDLSRTDNDVDFWGVNGYARWQQHDRALIADLGYTQTSNDLSQYIPGLGMDKFQADNVGGQAFTVGVRGEYKIDKGATQIIPHIGIRYTRLSTDGFDVTSGGVDVLHSSSDQSIWTLPIGVTFSKSIQQQNGWTVKPSLDLSIIPAAGNLDADSKGQFITGGAGSSYMISTEVLDRISYMGTLGVEFGKDNLTYGLNYNIHTSSNSTNQGIYAMVRYAF